MPNSRESQLLQRRAQLVQRSGVLRQSLVSDVGLWQPQTMLTRGADGALRWVQRHPEWLLGAAVVVLVARPSRLWRWAGRLMAVLPVARPLWKAFGPHRR